MWNYLIFPRYIGRKFFFIIISYFQFTFEGRLNMVINSFVLHTDGMAAFLNVRPSLYRTHSTKHLYGRTRRHFIAAEEVLWDYRPSNKVLARVGKASKERSRYVLSHSTSRKLYPFISQATSESYLLLQIKVFRHS